MRLTWMKAPILRQYRRAVMAGLLALSAGGLAVPAAQAQTADNAKLQSVRDAINKAFDVEVTQVRPTDYANLYEVQLGGNIVYTNEKAEFVLAGNLVDAKTKRDVTTDRIDEISKVDFSTLPLAQAVKLVKGDGARKMAVFEDPNCGYCKKLHKELATLDNVTVYTFLFPILAPDSMTKATSVWCAKDQATVWTDWMNKGVVPPDASCETPIEKNLALGQKLAVQGTPAIFFESGNRVNGYVPAARLNQELDRK
ncbi:disulfide bond formation protein DsbC [Advenella sp. S44]|uniref:DsbC family protein n=1 Tax=Advenella sp. S44 TaxID=1982755 RepID=UPI000C299BA2|nr:DsbC family protein [Advenella sp. S44]PJX25383.1 disulfide bond formation protein DsbC [Advenella sp. S44]